MPSMAPQPQSQYFSAGALLLETHGGYAPMQGACICKLFSCHCMRTLLLTFHFTLSNSNHRYLLTMISDSTLLNELLTDLRDLTDQAVHVALDAILHQAMAVKDTEWCLPQCRAVRVKSPEGPQHGVLLPATPTQCCPSSSCAQRPPSKVMLGTVTTRRGTLF